MIHLARLPESPGNPPSEPSGSGSERADVSAGRRTTSPALPGSGRTLRTVRTQVTRAWVWPRVKATCWWMTCRSPPFRRRAAPAACTGYARGAAVDLRLSKRSASAASLGQPNECAKVGSGALSGAISSPRRRHSARFFVSFALAVTRPSCSWPTDDADGSPLIVSPRSTRCTKKHTTGGSCALFILA